MAILGRQHVRFFLHPTMHQPQQRAIPVPAAVHRQPSTNESSSANQQLSTDTMLLSLDDSLRRLCTRCTVLVRVWGRIPETPRGQFFLQCRAPWCRQLYDIDGVRVQGSPVGEGIVSEERAQRIVDSIASGLSRRRSAGQEYARQDGVVSSDVHLPSMPLNQYEQTYNLTRPPPSFKYPYSRQLPAQSPSPRLNFPRPLGDDSESLNYNSNHTVERRISTTSTRQSHPYRQHAYPLAAANIHTHSQSDIGPPISRHLRVSRMANREPASVDSAQDCVSSLLTLRDSVPVLVPLPASTIALQPQPQTFVHTHQYPYAHSQRPVAVSHIRDICFPRHTIRTGRPHKWPQAVPVSKSTAEFDSESGTYSGGVPRVYDGGNWQSLGRSVPSTSGSLAALTESDVGSQTGQRQRVGEGRWVAIPPSDDTFNSASFQASPSPPLLLPPLDSQRDSESESVMCLDVKPASASRLTPLVWEVVR
ncbi:hypothetical protein C8F01DRAFT_102208 [Mycena amicta]|nr:hypothetical protein C8F01DRAFT_102208 [Mycena amicta]